MENTEILNLVQEKFQGLRDASNASQMKLYLRGQFEFLGIPTPVRRASIKGLSKAPISTEALLELTRSLWLQPEREFKYAAIDFLSAHSDQLDAAAVSPLLELALMEPWWETVDGLCGVLGDVIRNEKKRALNSQALMDAALTHSSLWIRRIAMTHQLGWRLETDSERLFNYAERLAPESDFFIRKAIGWALRDYARWNPLAVQVFIQAKQHSFSKLTVREASKHLGALQAV